MPLDLCDHEAHAQKAIRAFWRSRDQAKKRQVESGKVDQGGRAGVTAGQNLNEFVQLIRELVVRNGLSESDVHRSRVLLTLPGYFRPTKIWDVVVVSKGRLVAAIELKSQVGPSFGNNFNNRAEEAIGTAHDFWTAYREGAFGEQARPFLGWLMMVEDAPGSRSPIRHKAPHFPTFPEFIGASYLERYDILCKRLVQERLYTAASVIAASRASAQSGQFQELSEMSGLRSLVTTFAGHVASEAMR
jgi:hypothetical protein